MTIANEINRPISSVFRRAYIKRRSNTTGLYETDWFEITDYIKKWNIIQTAIDDIKLNEFKHSGISITCRNDEGKFNPETYVSSFWYGYMTRFRSLLKIEAGYITDDGTELPTASSQGIFILTNDVPINVVKNEALLKFKSLVSVFDEVLSTNVTGLGATSTASEIIEKIKDHTDGSGNYVFRQFISNTNWSIQTTTTNYNCATTTSLDGLSCWELMTKLSEAEGFIVLINREGKFEFRDRDERTTTSQFNFYGLNNRNQNVIALNTYNEPISKYYNYVRLKFLEDDTSTSFVTSGTITSVDPSLSTWKFGSRKYEMENEFIPDTTTAQTIATNLRNQFDDFKEELNITAKFCPQLEISDKITFSYQSFSLADQPLWDTKSWDEFNWAEEENDILDWIDVDFKILSKKHNLDKFTTSFILRRLSA